MNERAKNQLIGFVAGLLAALLLMVGVGKYQDYQEQQGLIQAARDSAKYPIKLGSQAQ